MADTLHRTSTTNNNNNNKMEHHIYQALQSTSWATRTYHSTKPDSKVMLVEQRKEILLHNPSAKKLLPTTIHTKHMLQRPATFCFSQRFNSISPSFYSVRTEVLLHWWEVS